MIQALLTDIALALRTAFTGHPAFGDPAEQIVIGPATPPDADTACMSLEQAELTVNLKGKDLASSTPRPIQNREEFGVSETGSYALTRIPLEGSLRARLVFPAGNTQLLTPEKDYQLDLNVPSITLEDTLDIGRATHLQVTYSYVGVHTLRNFSQRFFLHVHAPATEGASSIDNVEIYSSIALSVILTHHDELLEAFNTTQYHFADYTTEHRLSELAWLGQKLDASTSPDSFKFAFKVAGQLNFIREIMGGFGLIEQILSPEAFEDDSGLPVDIRPSLD